VQMNREVLTGVTRANAAWAFTTFNAANWHPLTWLSLQLDTQLFGTAPRGYHLTNLGLHSVNAALLFWALWTMTGRIWRSSFVAALFAFHPLHVESVAWIAERKDVLSAFFWMVACLAYSWYAARPALWRYLLTLLALAAGMLAKPMLVTLPFVFLLLDYWPLARFPSGLERKAAVASSSRRRDARSVVPGSWFALSRSKLFNGPEVRRACFLVIEKLPFFCLSVASCVMTWHAQEHGSAIQSLEDYPFSVRLANAVLAYCVYIGQTLWPVNLGMFYPHPAFTNQSVIGIMPWTVAGTAVCLLATT